VILSAIVLSMATALPVSAPEVPPVAAAEIEGLLGSLGRSECRFYRNGSWHDAAEAQSHLRNKYDYLVRKQTVHTAEEFIAGAGEKSSLSGKPYQVQCGEQTAQPSGKWLRDRLTEIRRSRKEASKQAAKS